MLLTGAGDDALGLRALRAGASGFLSKDMELASLPRALRGAVNGEAAISRRLAMRLVQHFRTTRAGGTGLRPVRSTLTDREWQVLDLLSGGASNEDIAQSLVLSHETVRTHLKNLYRKLQVRSREQAVEAANRLRGELGGPAGGLAVSPEQVGSLVEASDRGLVAEGAVSAVMVVVVRASRQGRRCVRCWCGRSRRRPSRRASCG